LAADVARLRLFGPAVDAAGARIGDVPGDTVGAVLDAACARFGEPFVRVLEQSRIWVNGVDAPSDKPVLPTDEVAVLPPVSGG
jgi:molybdopterin converting factor small subunit